jgi:hypothetical protein
MWQRPVTALRPLGVGERIDAAIKIVRKNFLTFAKAALAISIPAAVIVVLIVLTMLSSASSLFSTTNSTGGSTGFTVNGNGGDVATLIGGVFVLEFFSILVFTLITAVAYRIVGNAYLGQPTGWRDAVSFGLKRLHSVVWIQLLIAFAVIVAGFVVFLIIFLAAVTHIGALSVVLGLVLGFGSFAAVIWFWIATSLAIPTVMLENVRGTKAIRRSISLCRHNWWTTFGTVVLAYVLGYIGILILQTVVRFLLDLLGGGLVVLAIEGGVISLLTYMVTASFLAAVQIVITIDLRVRKEGFDILLLASQLGTAPTSSALSFMPVPRGAPAWGYGMPGGPGSPGYGGPGYPPPPGWQQGGGWPQPAPGPPQTWGQQPQGAPPGWPQPAPAPPPPPWGQAPTVPLSGRPAPGMPGDSGPLTSAEGVPLRPLPPFQPRGARATNSPLSPPPAPPPPPTQATPTDGDPEAPGGYEAEPPTGPGPDA